LAQQAAALPNVFVIYISLCEISKNFQECGRENRPFVRMFQEQFQPALENEDFKKNI
jgi:hypothetical protein